jgi:hypothetical protein
MQEKTQLQLLREMPSKIGQEVLKLLGKASFVVE